MTTTLVDIAREVNQEQGPSWKKFEVLVDQHSIEWHFSEGQPNLKFRISPSDGDSVFFELWHLGKWWALAAFDPTCSARAIGRFIRTEVLLTMSREGVRE